MPEIKNKIDKLSKELEKIKNLSSKYPDLEYEQHEEGTYDLFAASANQQCTEYYIGSDYISVRTEDDVFAKLMDKSIPLKVNADIRYYYDEPEDWDAVRQHFDDWNIPQKLVDEIVGELKRKVEISKKLIELNKEQELFKKKFDIEINELQNIFFHGEEK